MVDRDKTETGLAPIDNSIRALWSAVIIQAITDMELREKQKTKANNTWLREAALRWIASSEQHEGSMFWICEMLDLDFRKLQMMALTKSGRQKILMSKKMRDRLAEETE